ncbi:hypothetical protein PIB30_013531 [Stylosanthes scabra]|uniref:Uncharacterized protein n=1 Tax=Stylosanthes scabra TaxID=79078 RepID=A0ABU6R6X2_9FABA|nr:hypothetical protein [Stylosanthes scabra]
MKTLRRHERIILNTQTMILDTLRSRQVHRIVQGIFGYEHLRFIASSSLEPAAAVAEDDAANDDGDEDKADRDDDQAEA